MKENDIKQILSEPSKPQSNGMIERANATIKELIQKSIELDETQHRITGFTPNQIKEAYENDDKALLENEFDTELKKQFGNISKEIFKIRDLVRIYQPSDKTRKVWSNEIYTIEKVFKPLKSIVSMNIN